MRILLTDLDVTPGTGQPCTAAFQRAVDRCADAGGGTVVVPPGEFVTGTVQLRSNVTI